MSNVVVCPECGYCFLFPPAEEEWRCPVCSCTVTKEVK